jgi:hypothetical protein
MIDFVSISDNVAGAAVAAAPFVKAIFAVFGASAVAAAWLPVPGSNAYGVLQILRGAIDALGQNYGNAKNVAPVADPGAAPAEVKP